MLLPRPRTYQELLERTPDPDADPYERTVVSLEATRLRRELRRLPAVEREILCRLYGVAGLPAPSSRELARRLGLSEAAVRSLEERGLEGLRKRMRPEGEAA
jgi:DNA-directed RNA polymerase specialized sigma24 family protein